MFWRKPAVSDDMRDWIGDCFDWFDARFPPPPEPILPTKSFFTAGRGTDDATARQVLTDIKRLMHVTVPIELLPLYRPGAEYRHDYQSMGEVAGTFQDNEDGGIIRYDPEQMHRPLVFINVMAHEVMHARLAPFVSAIPGGPEAHELATDLGCIIAGFGIFQLQAADDQGWSGYMTQASRAHALALFLHQRGLGADAVADHLGPRPKRLLKQAFKTL